MKHYLLMTQETGFHLAKKSDPANDGKDPVNEAISTNTFA